MLTANDYAECIYRMHMSTAMPNILSKPINAYAKPVNAGLLRKKDYIYCIQMRSVKRQCLELRDKFPNAGSRMNGHIRVV